MRKLVMLFLICSAFSLSNAQVAEVSIYDFIRINEGFGILIEALDDTELGTTLQSDGSFTLFACSTTF